MRQDNYDFVFAGWAERQDWARWGWELTYHNGLPYVELYVVTPGRAIVNVRCDPCSLDQSRTAYAAMARADLTLALERLNHEVVA